jgi:sugar lactone lactonase YvrE
MAATDVVVNPETDGWAISYRADDRVLVSAYLVKSICYPDGSCIVSGRHAVPDWLTFAPDSKTIYVADTALRMVSAIDTKRMKEVRESRSGKCRSE